MVISVWIWNGSVSPALSSVWCNQCFCCHISLVIFVCFFSRPWAVTSGIFQSTKRKRSHTLFIWWRAVKAGWTRNQRGANKWNKVPRSQRPDTRVSTRPNVVIYDLQMLAGFKIPVWMLTVQTLCVCTYVQHQVTYASHCNRVRRMMGNDFSFCAKPQNTTDTPPPVEWRHIWC